MCLGTPARIVEISGDHPHIAFADLQGVRREINIGLVEADGVGVGDWVLVHMGMAMSPLTADEARSTLEFLESLTDWDGEAVV